MLSKQIVSKTKTASTAVTEKVAMAIATIMARAEAEAQALLPAPAPALARATRTIAAVNGGASTPTVPVLGEVDLHLAHHHSCSLAVEDLSLDATAHHLDLKVRRVMVPATLAAPVAVEDALADAEVTTDPTVLIQDHHLMADHLDIDKVHSVLDMAEAGLTWAIS
jgi:tetraacyldisaccharide-1-P 4'-kinase